MNKFSWTKTLLWSLKHRFLFVFTLLELDGVHASDLGSVCFKCCTVQDKDVNGYPWFWSRDMQESGRMNMHEKWFLSSSS